MGKEIYLDVRDKQVIMEWHKDILHCILLMEQLVFSSIIRGEIKSTRSMLNL